MHCSEEYLYYNTILNSRLAQEILRELRKVSFVHCIKTEEG